MGTAFLSRGYDDKPAGILETITKINGIKRGATLTLPVPPETSVALVSIYGDLGNDPCTFSLCPGYTAGSSVDGLSGALQIRFNNTQYCIEVTLSSSLGNAFELSNIILVLCI